PSRRADCCRPSSGAPRSGPAGRAGAAGCSPCRERLFSRPLSRGKLVTLSVGFPSSMSWGHCCPRDEGGSIFSFGKRLCLAPCAVGPGPKCSALTLYLTHSTRGLLEILW